VFVMYVQGYSVRHVCTNLFPFLNFSEDICQHTVQVVSILPRVINQLVKILLDAGKVKVFQHIDKIPFVLPHLRSHFRKSLLDTGNFASHPCHDIVVTGRKMLPLQNVFIRRVLGAATLQQGFFVKRSPGITLTFKFVVSTATCKECIESPSFAIQLSQLHQPY
jgi:hypothetical protein